MIFPGYGIIVMCSLIWNQNILDPIEGGQINWIFYYLTFAYQNLESVKLKQNILVSVYF